LSSPEIFEGWCEVCGDVQITLEAAERARALGKAHFLSAALKRRPATQEYDTIRLDDVERVAKDAPSYTELERMSLVLSLVAARTEQPGAFSRFQYTTDYPLGFLASADEAMFYLRELHEQGYLQVDSAKAKVTMKGYKQVQEVQRSGRQSSIVFVAMSFDPSRTLVYEEAISPAIHASGYAPLRIDRFEHVNRIDDEIIGQIRRSRFTVADFTGQRAGVYFEAGLTLGLGRNVVWMCEKSELSKVHFDTRQYNFIDYESASDVKMRLFHRILAIEGEGPNPPPLSSSKK
jgi:hypothetical protein